jgi:phosphoenolpyruvate carboxylase
MRDGVMVTCIVCPFRSNMRPTMIATVATCWTRKCATKAVTSARRFSSTADSVSTGATLWRADCNECSLPQIQYKI